MGNPIFELFSNLMHHGDNDEVGYEPIAPLSEKDNKEWEKLLSNHEKAESRVEEIEAKKKLFWIKIERKLGIYNRELKIDGGIVLGEVEHKNNCEHTGDKLAQMPGFCGGDCEDCALKPEDTEEDNRE